MLGVFDQKSAGRPGLTANPADRLAGRHRNSVKSLNSKNDTTPPHCQLLYCFQCSIRLYFAARHCS